MKTPNVKNIKWQKTGGNSFQFKKSGDTVTGILKGSRVQSTKFGKQTVFTIEQEKGNSVDVFSSAVLDHIQDIKKGTPIKIVFKGIVKKGKKSYKNFDIYTPEV
jgi:hypothetical protein